MRKAQSLPMSEKHTNTLPTDLTRYLDSAFASIDVAAHEAATGHNSLPNPTERQIRSNRYKLGRVKVHGLAIGIENARGTFREGVSPDGTAWRNRMAGHYGNFTGTRGADGDAIDVFIGPMPESGDVWVINQRAADGSFDEHKVVLGATSEDQARSIYQHSYDRDWRGLMSIVPATVGQLKWWLKHGNHTIPMAASALPYDPQQKEVTMDKVLWTADAEPVDQSIARVLYGIRSHDGAAGLILDAMSMADIYADPEIESLVSLDAMVVDVGRMQQKMTTLQRVMEAAGGAVKCAEMAIGEPMKSRGTMQIPVLFTMSDGQTVTVWFHNPDTTPAKLTPMDELVSWKWLINKKDVTIVVAPERGRDLNPREVGRRIMALVETNSPAFTRANAKVAERAAAITSLNGEITGLETELSDLNQKIDASQLAREARATAKPAWMSQQFDPTEPENYAVVQAAGNAALEYRQDELDSFFQGRLVDVRNALRELGWEGERNAPLSKDGHTLKTNFEQVGGVRNIVGMSFEISGVTGFFMSDTLVHSAADLAGRINSGLPAKQVEPVATNAIEQDAAALTADIAANMRSGDLVKDADGKEWALVRSRHDWAEAAPMVDGRPQVSADTVVRFHLDPGTADAYPERNHSPLYATGVNAYGNGQEPAAAARTHNDWRADADATLAALVGMGWAITGKRSASGTDQVFKGFPAGRVEVNFAQSNSRDDATGTMTATVGEFPKQTPIASVSQGIGSPQDVAIDINAKVEAWAAAAPAITETDEEKAARIKATPGAQKTDEEISWYNQWWRAQQSPALNGIDPVRQAELEASRVVFTEYASSVMGNSIGRAQIVDTLMTIRKFTGGEARIGDKIRELVSAGWVVSEKMGGPALVGPNGAFLTQRDLTKIALDYARRLLSSAPVAESATPAATAFDWLEFGAVMKSNGWIEQGGFRWSRGSEANGDAYNASGTKDDFGAPVIDLEGYENGRPSGFAMISYEGKGASEVVTEIEAAIEEDRARFAPAKAVGSFEDQVRAAALAGATITRISGGRGYKGPVGTLRTEDGSHSVSIADTSAMLQVQAILAAVADDQSWQKPDLAELSRKPSASSIEGWFTGQYNGTDVWTNGHIVDLSGDVPIMAGYEKRIDKKRAAAGKPDVGRVVPAMAGVEIEIIAVKGGKRRSVVFAEAGMQGKGKKVVASAAYVSYFLAKYKGKCVFRAFHPIGAGTAIVVTNASGKKVGVLMPMRDDTISETDVGAKIAAAGAMRSAEAQPDAPASGPAPTVATAVANDALVAGGFIWGGADMPTHYFKTIISDSAKHAFSIRDNRSLGQFKLTEAVSFPGTSVSGASRDLGLATSEAEAIATIDARIKEVEQAESDKAAANAAADAESEAAQRPENVIAAVDSAYRFTDASDDFKLLASMSIADEDYSLFATAKTMDERVHSLGGTVSWRLNADVIMDSVGADTAGITSLFDDDAEVLLDKAEQVNQFKEGDRVINIDTQADMIVTGQRGYNVSCRGQAKPVHANRLKLANGSKPKTMMLDSVSFDAAGELEGTPEGIIRAGGAIIGRAVIMDGDGKAMVFVGEDSTERVTLAGGSRAMWSDDDAGEMIDALFAATIGTPPRSTLTPDEQRAVAQEIGRQLGGSKFKAMTGAKNFVSMGGENAPKGGLQFSLPTGFSQINGKKTGINRVAITLNSNDLYDVDFSGMRGVNSKPIASDTDVGSEDLQALFTRRTGLDTSMGKITTATPAANRPEAWTSNLVSPDGLKTLTDSRGITSTVFNTRTYAGDTAVLGATLEYRSARASLEWKDGSGTYMLRSVGIRDGEFDTSSGVLSELLDALKAWRNADAAEDEAAIVPKYRYGMVNRPAMVGALPHGLMFEVEPRPEPGQPFHDIARNGILVTERELTEAELKNFELARLNDAAGEADLATRVTAELAEYATGYLRYADKGKMDIVTENTMRTLKKIAPNDAVASTEAFVAAVVEKMRAGIPAVTPEPAGPVATEPAANPDRALLDAMIAGTTDLEDAGLMAKIEDFAGRYANDAEMMALVEKAAEAYVAYAEKMAA